MKIYSSSYRPLIAGTMVIKYAHEPSFLCHWLGLSQFKNRKAWHSRRQCWTLAPKNSVGLSIVGMSRVKSWKGVAIDPPITHQRLQVIGRSKQLKDRLEEESRLANLHLLGTSCMLYVEIRWNFFVNILYCILLVYMHDEETSEGYKCIVEQNCYWGNCLLAEVYMPH